MVTSSKLTGFRLSPQQEDVWRAQGSQPSLGFVCQGILEIRGPLDRSRLRRAVERTVERHEILRTSFRRLPGMSLPVQVIRDRGQVAWSEPETSGPGEAEVERLLAEARWSPFPLEDGPALQASLLSLGEERHALLLTLPALVADARSLSVLANEIASLYGGEEGAEDLPDPLQYADAAESLQEWLGPEDGPGAAFWRQQGAPALRPVDAGEPAVPGTVRRRLPAGFVAALGRPLEIPVPLLLLAAWRATLWWETGEARSTLAVAHDGRTFDELSEAVGPYARYLPLQSAAGPGLTLGELARSLEGAATTAAAWQDAFSLDRLATGSAGEGAVPFWPAGFDSGRTAILSPAFSLRPGFAGLGRFGLRLSVLEEDAAVRLDLHYDPSHHNRGQAERLLDRLERVLAGVAAHREAPIGEIDVLTEAERRELLVGFNDTAAAYPAGATVCDLFEERVRLAPQAPAVATPEGLSLTFQELDARANRLARYLGALGIGPESRVGIHLEREPEMVVALLAVLKAGGAYVPFDPGHPAERLRFLMQDAGLAALVTRERLRPEGVDTIRTLLVDPESADAQAVSRQEATPPPRPAGPDNAAYVIYTSGSTGLPKGVVVTHRGLANYLGWARTAYETEGGAPVHSPLGFDLTVTSLFVPLLAGAAVTLLPEQEGIGALAEALRAHRVRHGTPFGLAKITPAHLGLLRHLTADGEPPPSAACLVIGGDALWAADIAPWRRLGTRIFNEYGPTETVVGCSVHEVDPGSPETGAVSIGRPIANTRLYVMGPGLRPVPAGVPGELWIGGDGVARGYLGRPELTAERFVPDPFALPERAGGRLYRTGDLVSLRPSPGSGLELEFLGRIDDQIKIRGHRIEPGEVAAALASHPDLRDAAVALRDTGGDRQLVAWVVARDRARRPAAGELRRFLAGRLPEPMIPGAYVHLDVLPLTPNGKLDRRALPDPDPQRDEETPYVPPSTLSEEVLAEIWGYVLGVDRMGIDDHFFSRGGDSIRSLQVLALAQKRGLSLTLQDLFERPTIRLLAERVRFDGATPEVEPAPFALVSAADRERLEAGLEDAYPLTRLQAGMLYHSELAPESAVYHDLHSFHLRGRYDAEQLAAAIAQVMRRHPVLRTSFDLHSFGEPLQLVHRQVELPLTTEDLRHLSLEEGRRITLDWLDREAFRPFDWSRAPLARFQIHRFGEDNFQFTLSFHHSILDGWSAASLLTELFRRYLSLLEDPACPEEAPPKATLREFGHLERTVLAATEAREFWRRHLEGSPLVRLSRQRAAGGAADRRAEHVVTQLPPDLSNGLMQVARSLSLPLKSLLMAVHFRVLGLLSGLTDVVSGVVSNGRPERSDGERAIGLFLNTLPLRMALPGGSWGELANAAFDLERGSLPFRRFPLSELQRMEGGRTLFEIAFNFMHYHVYDSLAQLTGLEVLSREGYEETNFSLITHFNLGGAAQQIHLGLAYQAAEHDRGEMEEVARRYLAALEGMAADPQAPYDAWALFTEAEREELLAWNRTASPMRLPRRLHEIFAAQAERTPEAPAAEIHGETMTYRELAHRAGRLARRLRAAGVKPDDPVGMCLERSLAVPVAVLGILEAGGAYLPLDPFYPAERLAVMAEDAGLRWLVCDEASLGRLPAGLWEQTQGLLLGPAGEIGGGEADAVAPWPVEPENLAYVLYTSGSTGRPKGVAMPHGSLANLIDWQIAATTAPGPRRTLQFASLSFDVSFQEMFTTWAQGGTLVLLTEEVRRDPGALLRLLSERSIEQIFLPFVALQQLADEAAASGLLPASLREVITAGEQLQSTAAVRELFRRLPGCRLVNDYGPTEAHVVTAFTLAESPDTWPTLPPIGPPIANLWTRVLDASSRPVLPGVPGELYLGGAGLARGYLGRPDRTAERFLPDPQATEPGARVYRTGDLARHLPDGAIEFLGRTDHQVKVRGFRVEPGEIEAVLTLHAGVREAAVVVRERPGAGDRRLVGYVVPRGGSAAEAGEALTGELRTFLASRLPDYMVPSAWVLLDSLPLTPSGKLDRRSLPAPTAARSEGELTPPRGPVEELLAGIWAEVLGLERVGATDDFFELGGHSLLATRVMSRLRSVFDVAMPLRALFEAPALAALAARVEEALRADAGPLTPPLVPVSRDGALPLSFAQLRLWFLDQLEPGSPLYNMPIALRVEGPLDCEVLELCLTEIVRRHEALRTVFAAPGGSPVQVIRPAAPSRLPVVDLSGLPESRREPLALALAAREARHPFDLKRGPLLRGLLLRLAQADHVVALTMHHIVSDGWSLGILVREVAALYPAFAAGRPSPLPELPLQYADFAAWQTSWLQGELLESEIAFWHGQLAGLPPLLELPTDRPRPAVQSFRGSSRPVHLPAAIARQVQALGRREGATPFMVLLAGFQALLARYSGQDDLAVGTPVAGRNRLEIEGLIGFFINTLVMRGDLTGRGGAEPSFRALLGRVRETALAAYAHQDVPFEKLVQVLAPERSLAHAPLFQVMFDLQNAPTASPEIRDLRLRPVSSPSVTAKFDLTLNLAEHGGGLSGTVAYATGLFDPATIDRLILHFERLLATALATPELAASGLPLLSPAERHQLRAEWSGPCPPEPPGPGLPERFFAAAARWPEAVALRLGEGALTYGELADRVRRRAADLSRRGVGPETLTALCFERSFAMVEAVLAVLSAGGAFVALDPRSPERLLASLLAEAGPGWLLTQERLLARLPGRNALEALVLDAEEPTGGTGRSLPPPPDPRALAYLTFTSGSTGAPKGILGTHGAVASYLDYLDTAWPLSPEDRVLQLARLSFDASIRDLLYPLTRGASVALLSDDEARDPAALKREIEARGVTCLLSAVPSLLQALVEAAAPGTGSGTLRLILTSGEPLPLALCRRVREVFGEDVRIANQYGPSEGTMTSTVQPVAPEHPEAALALAGRPIPRVTCHVLAPRLEEVPAGVVGQVFLGGAGLTRGYLNRPALTAERFLPDPFSLEPGQRLYATGDLGRLRPEGSLELLGRLDHQVKIRGIRLELGEVEAALAAHPEIERATASVRDGRLVAYVAGRGGLPQDLRPFLAERLPEHAVPSLFVALETLPLNANGKIDRRALPAPEWQGSEEGYLAPRTPVEEVLAGLWAELLGLERVGATGHFFDLGGHSLLATRVMSRLRETFGVEIPLRGLFEAPVLADLAVRVEAARRAGAAPPAPPLVPVPREGPLPLSFAQQRLWFIDQLEPGSPLYNMPVALRVEGPLDAGVLARTLGEIVRRHEVLRTVFAEREGVPIQIIRPAAAFALPVVDLSGLPESRRAERALALAGQEAVRPFDLAGGPLLRGVLLRLAEEDHLAAVTLHHIAGDAWSMGILVREVTALYAAFTEGRPSPLRELPVQYADFAVWQSSWLRGEVLEGEIAFWRRQLAHLPALLALPTDRPRPAVQSYRGAARPVRLPAALLGQATALARSEGATLFMVLLAAFETLLARYSGQDDLAVGSPVAGRNRVETEGLIGFFVNTLVLRGDLAGEPSFRQLLGRGRETLLAAHLHQDVPFEKLVQELVPERSLAHSPLFQAMLALQNAPLGSLEIPSLRLRRFDAATTTAKFDLTLNLMEHGDGLGGSVEYATGLFDAATVDRLIGHFERLLRAAVAAPDRSVRALPLASPAERWQILAEWNDTAPPLPREAVCLHELFAAQTLRTPDAVALIDGPREISYRELAQTAGRLATLLRDQGAGPEVVAGVFLERSAEMVTALLAILGAGAAYLPLDPRLPRPRLAGMLAGARASLVVSDGKLAAGLPWSGPVVRVDEALTTTTAGETGSLFLDPENLAYVLFTSGSTGTPKGVAVTHRSAVEMVRWAGSVYRPEELAGVLAATALSFDLSVFELFVPLSLGGTVILAQNVLELPDLLSSGPAAGRVTLVNTVPSALSELVRAGSLGASVRTVNLAGEPLPRELADRLYATGTVERVWNLYGPSEDTTYSTFSLIAREDTAAPRIGRPVTATRACVLAAGPDMELLPAGVVGELHLGGAGLARGYLHRPDLTAERFLPDPFAEEPGARLYRTGDRVRWTAQGELEFLGRFDHQVKIRGFRIELGEIEQALLSLPGVREAVVVAREGRLVAYVAGTAAADALRQPLRERLPDYMVPAAFVLLEALPLTPNGKVDRKALPAPESRSPEESYVAPRTPVEEVVAGLWAELLGLERVGAADHFFDLGGHSLLATRVMSRLRSAFEIEMSLRDLFEAPRLADLAARVEAALRAGAGRLTPPLVPVPREGPLPLSFAQQRLWFLDRFEPGLPLYNLPVALRIEGPLDSAVLALCIGEIVRRHESLRTVFAAPEGAPVQVIQPAAPFGLALVDLSGLPESRRREVASHLAGEEALRPFDLTRDPLLRGRLLRLAAESHVLALTLHHIVSDGWSMGILVREVTALYAAFAGGRRSPLPELPVQYGDFSVWQRSWLRGEVLEGEIDFWRRQLADLPPLLALPTDRPRPAAQSFHGSRQAVELPCGLAPAVAALARRLGATPFMVLLAGFAALLARHAGQEDVVVGTPVANRNQDEIEGLIGFFVNTLALRVDLTGDPEIPELVARVREMTLGAYLHQDLPFEKLVDELKPERSLAQAPIFQVMLVLDNAPRGAAQELPGLRFERFEAEPRRSAKFDLTVFLTEGPHGLAGLWEYATDLFDATTVARLARGFELLLAGLLARPESRLSELSPFAEPEKHQLLVEWNGTSGPETDTAVHRLIERQAKLTPEAVAVVAAGGELTYAALEGAANRIAHNLRRRGIGPGARVGLCAGRSPGLVAAILGILKAGAAYVPLDPGYPQERLAWMLEDSGAAALLTEERLAARLPEPAAGVLRLDADRGLLERESAEPLDGGEDLDDLAYVIYTSGSTGRPKGVMVSHRGLLAYLGFARTAYAAPGAAGSLLHTSISFDLSVTSLFVPLICGQRLALAPEADSPEALGRALSGERDLAFLKLTPSHARMLGQQLPPGELAGRSRGLVVGGEALLAEDLAAWRDGAPETMIYNEYGPTEAVVGCCLYAVPARDLGRGALLIGRPIPGARVVLLDGWQEAPLGAAGELCVGGPGLARGYLGRPDLTAERFVPDPLGHAFDAGGGRLYRTGDLARWRPQGELEYLGRLDQQVKIRGFRIEPGEIEAALLEHGGVREAAVLARKEGAVQQLVAFYAPGPEPGELQRYLAGRLPAHLVPSAFVPLESLPLTPNGKVDLRALARLERPGRQQSYRAPRTPVEELLAKIWGELLGVERVGVDDNFFALGGDSILSLQVVSRAAKAGYRLQPRQIFERQTLAELAEVAGSGLAVDAEQGPVAGEVPLTPAQSWFLGDDPADPHHFNQAVMLAVRRPVAPAVVERALGALLAHHDALRLRFTQGPEGWRQWNAAPEPGAPVPWLRVDLSALPLPRSLAALEEAAGEVQASLDLARGPLLCGAWFDPPAGAEPRLLLAIHHLAVDGVSWRVLLEDLDIACRQLDRGQAVSLPPKTTSFRRWAERLCEHARSMPLEPELSWWLAQQEGASGGAAADFPGGDNVQGSARRATASLSAEETRSLLQEVPAAYRTRIDEVLLTALAQAFGGTVLVELEGHGREEEAVEQVDLSRTVGWFTSLFPLRLDAGAETDPGAALCRVKEHLRALPRRGIGYGLLRYGRGDTDVERQLAGSPRPQVSFNYLGQFDQVLSEGSALFAPTGEPTGPVRSPRAVRPYALDVSAAVTGGRLQVSWTYSRNLHHPDTVERLSESFFAHLRELIAHCRAAAEQRIGGYTPSDFPLARLGPAELDRLLGTEWGIADVYPLSPLQEGILFQSLFAPRSGAYFEQLVCTLCGDDRDAGILEAACRLLVERHPILRTSFHWDGLERPLQVVHGETAVAVERQDWRDLDASAREQRLEELLQADRAQGFDLSRQPVMRWRLLRTAEDRHWFLWSYNHILLDGWSFSILANELLACCAALRAGAEPDLPRRRPYRDYIAWLAEQSLDEAREFWQRTLAGWTEPTPLVVDRREGGTDRGTDRRELRLSAADTSALEARARELRVTLNTLVQAAWALLLARYGGRSDVVFGATVAGRPATLPEAESIVGLFINTLPVRVSVAGTSRLDAWLQRLQLQQSELRQYEHSPLVQVQEWSQVPRRLPLFESILVFESYPRERSLGQGGSGLEVRGVRTVEQTHYPLTLVAGPGSELLLHAAFNLARFDPATVERLLGHLSTLLGAISAAPESRLDELPLLTGAERLQILGEWNEAGDEPGGARLHDLFEAWAERTPATTAIFFEGTAVTYGEAEASANRLAHRLQALGVGPETRVGLCCGRSPEALIAMLGVLKAGGAYVPLDPGSPRERLAAIAADAGISLLLTQERLAPALAGLADRLLLLDAAAEGLPAESAERPACPALPDNAAYVIYTSGSTGGAKGVIAPHRGVVNFTRALAAAIGLGLDDRLLLFAPLSFDASVLQIFPPLASGAAVVVHPDPRELASHEILALCERHGVTVLDLPAALWRQWVEDLATQRLPLPASLRAFLTGGESVPVERLRTWAGLVERPASFLSSYGPTEATVTTTVFQTRSDQVHALAGEIVPLGRPLAGTRAHVLDGALQPAPGRVPGELFLAGAGLARGYLGRPDLTADAFRPDPFATTPGSRLYRTGDLAVRTPDGNLRFLGRSDHQVKLRGFRLELGEIEAALRRHPAVREAVALLREDPAGEPRLVAYVVPQEGWQAADPADLRTLLAELLPAYMVPSAFVSLEELPVLPSGKLDRAALPAPAGFALATDFVAPRDPLEQILAEIWAQVLKVERVGAFDNFFDLGGHSLMATQAVSRIRQAFDIDFPLRSLFEEPTIAGLAESLRRSSDGDKVEQTAALRIELAGLSDEEVKALLLADATTENEKGLTS